MSIILKGVEIPDGTDFAHITFTKKGNFLDDIEFFIDEIVQIPKDHGRLIDGDELVKHLRKDPLFDLVERYGISGVIESRPTILDEERE